MAEVAYAVGLSKEFLERLRSQKETRWLGSQHYKKAPRQSPPASSDRR